MKTFFVAAALLVASHANADCAPIQYEEMKDMSEAELQQVFCSALDTWFSVGIHSPLNAQCKPLVEQTRRTMIRRGFPDPVESRRCPGQIKKSEDAQ